MGCIGMARTKLSLGNLDHGVYTNGAAPALSREKLLIFTAR